MINTLKIGFVILYTLLLNACVMGGGQMGGQMAVQNANALQSAGPVGRVALNTSGGNNTLFVQGAGDSGYAGSGFDARTHAATYQRYLMDRPLIMTGGGRPPVIMVPDAGELTVNGNPGPGTAPANNGGSHPGESASAVRVDRIARTVSRLSARQEEQGRVLQRIDQRLRRPPPPTPPTRPAASNATPAPATPPAYVIDEWMVEAQH